MGNTFNNILNQIGVFFSRYYPVFGVAILSIMFCVLMYKWMFTPRKKSVQSHSSKNRKNIDSGINFRENQKALQAKLDIANFIGKMPVVGFSDRDREEIQKLILAVDKRTQSGRLMLPEEIYCTQLLIALCVVVVCAIAMFISPLCIVGVLVAPFLMRIPVRSLESDRKSFALALADEFLSFYKLYYVQFIQPDNTTTLSYVINSYLPSASLEVKKILKVVDGDLAKGEEFALKRWDQRFPDCPKVHKFCSVARARINGDETSFETMRSFLELLQEEHDVFFERECSKRERRIQTVISAYLLIGVSIVCCMAFAMMLL